MLTFLFGWLLSGSVGYDFWSLCFVAAAWFTFRAASELFSPCGLYPPEELKRSFHTTAAAFLIHFGVLFAAGPSEPFHMLPLLAWPMAMLVTYGLRGMARSSLLARRCYGVPVVVVGNGESARRAIAELNATPEMGYVPVAVFTSELTAEHERDAIAGVPLVGRLEAASQYVFPYKVSHAVLAVGSGWEHEGNQLLARRLAERYPSLQIFSGLPAHGHWLARVRPIGPYITIERTTHASLFDRDV